MTDHESPDAGVPDADVVAERLAAVRARIAAAGGDPLATRVVAVTKGFGPGAVEAAVAAGVEDVGENYAAELLDKAAKVATAPQRWHFLGALQRRKVRDLARVVDCWQTIGRIAEGQTVAHHCPGANVLVEVEVAGVAGRPGVSWEDAPALVNGLRGLDLDVRGLMAVGPPGPPEQARPAFRRLAELARALVLPELSMGMSEDLEVAVAEGATMIRVGRALFGPRPSPRR